MESFLKKRNFVSGTVLVWRTVNTQTHKNDENDEAGAMVASV